MNEDDLEMNEVVADDAAGVDADGDAVADARQPAAAEAAGMAGRRTRRSGAIPRLVVRVCLGLVTLTALAIIFLRGGSPSGSGIGAAALVLHLQPAEGYGKAFVQFEDQRIEDESSLQRMLSEQQANRPQQIVLRTAGAVSQKEIDRISRLIRLNLPEARVVVVGSAGTQSGEKT